MGNMSWTSAQLSAIDTNAKETAVFAAAGSGKTATLTERIIRLICDPDSKCDISRMLIVTFTRAATAELKERIRVALTKAIAEKKSSRLTRQLYALPRAKICTIHSFCMSVLRPHYAELSLSPSFRVLDEAEAKILRKNAMQSTVNDMFEDRSTEPLMAELADAFGAVKDDAALDEELLRLANMLAANGIAADDAASELGRFSEKYRNTNSATFLREELASPIVSSLSRFLNYYRAVFSYCLSDMAHSEKLNEKYAPAAIELLEIISRMEKALENKSYSELKNCFSSVNVSKLQSVPAAAQTDVSLYFKEAKKSFSAEAKKLGERFFSVSADSLDRKLTQNADILEKAAVVINKYYDTLKSEKKRMNAIDYGDLEYYTAKLLRAPNGQPTAIAAALASNFDHAFIDEYQDTNKLQDSIFSALAECGVKRFVVGDVKQSIYAFRGARPEIFTSYRNRTGDGSKTVFMSENFRCDPTVINFANFVSEYMFQPTPVPIEESDLLKAGKARAGFTQPIPVSVYLIPSPRKSSQDDESEDADDANAKLSESAFVANEVKKLLSDGYLADGSKIRGKDIAILVRNPSSSAHKYTNELKLRGIKVNEKENPDFFNQPEILLAVSILHTVDNPTNEIYLAGAMFSPVFSFTLDKLVAIRAHDRSTNLWDNVTSLAQLNIDELSSEKEKCTARKCRDFYTLICRLRQSIRTKSAANAVYHIFTELGLFRILKSDGGKARANIFKLYDLARQSEASAYPGLYGFLKKLDGIIELGASVESPAADKDIDPDAVSVMSIHASKGLEFPVCIIAESAKSFNSSDQRNALLFDSRYGATMRLPDETALLRLNTPLREALSEAIRESQTEEEMRILYVAMTRAKERLIITASLPSPEDSLNHARADASMYYALDNDATKLAFKKQTVYSAQNYITWILGAIMQNGTQDAFRLAIASELDVSADAGTQSSAPRPEAHTSPERVKAILSRLEFKYPNGYLSNIPSKLTVSKLTPTSLDIYESAPESLDADVEPETREGDIPVPRFISEASRPDAAQKGTFTHMFLQFCDFKAIAERGVSAEFDRLLEAQFLPREARDNINLNSLRRFADSDIFKEILSSPFVKREFRFNALLPAEDFTGERELAEKLARDNVKITVQGVFDCIYRAPDGTLTLLDYKTDSLTAEEFHDHALAGAKLIARHENQLKNYRRIAEMIFAEPIKRTILYSLTLGRGFEIPQS